MRMFGLSFISFLMLSSAANAECPITNDEDIRQLISGNTIVGESVNGTRFSEYLKQDGTTYFKKEGGNVTPGIWHVYEGSVCFSYGQFASWSCKKISNQENCSSQPSREFLLRKHLEDSSDISSYISLMDGDPYSLFSENGGVSAVRQNGKPRENSILHDASLQEIIWNNLLKYYASKPRTSREFHELPVDVISKFSTKYGSATDQETLLEYLVGREVKYADESSDEWFQSQFKDMLPDDAWNVITSKVNRVNLFLIDGCGPASLLEWGNYPSEWHDSARLTLVFEASGLRYPYDRSLDIRGHNYTTRHKKYNRSLRNLNSLLFQEWRRSGSGNIPIVLDPSEGCGAGEVGVSFVSNAPIRRLSIVQDFFFQVCRQQDDVDPWNNEECIFWRDVDPDYAQLSGAHRYKVEWSDGDLSTGSFSVNWEEAVFGDVKIRVSK